MINDVGKTAAIIRLNDYVINMVNSTISSMMQGTLVIYDDDGVSIRYQMTVDSSSVDCRCLMYSRSFSGDSTSNRLRPVMYIPPVVIDVGTGGVTCIPLYECISPSAAKLVNGNYQLTWWSNYDSTPEQDVSGRYIYDYTRVHRFHTSELGDVSGDSSACKVLCTAPVHWERVQYEGYDGAVYSAPLIRDIAILACISGEGYIVDFSTGGGGGGGTRIHNHLSTQECGFAGAVFMPSAVPRIMSWS